MEPAPESDDRSRQYGFPVGAGLQEKTPKKKHYKCIAVGCGKQEKEAQLCKAHKNMYDDHTQNNAAAAAADRRLVEGNTVQDQDASIFISTTAPPPALALAHLSISTATPALAPSTSPTQKSTTTTSTTTVPASTEVDHSHGAIKRGHAERVQPINYNGIVVAFGDNCLGQLGRGNGNYLEASSTPLVVEKLSSLKVTMVASSYVHSLALTMEGKVYSWGESSEGSLGRKIGTENTVASSPSLVTGFHPSSHGPNGPVVDGTKEEARIVQITAGQHHSLALSSDGDVYMFGTYVDEQDKLHRHVPPQDDTRPSTGYEDMDEEENKHPPPRGFQCWPVFVSGLTQKVKKISTGACFNAALLEDHSVVTFGGDNTHGQLARPVPKLDKSTMKDETLLGIVEHEYLTPKPPTWAVLSKMKHVTTMSCGGYHLLVVTSEGDVYSSGLNESGQLGLGDVRNRNSLHKIEYFATHNIDISTVEGGGMFSCFVNRTGRELYTCGRLLEGFSCQCLPRRTPLVFDSQEGRDKIDCTDEVSDIIENDQPTISQVSCGGNHVLVRTCDGSVYSWGLNDFGRCGHVGLEHHDVPRPKMIETSGAFSSGALFEFQYVNGGKLHSVAIVNRNYCYDILTDFYKKHDATKLPKIPMILRKYHVRLVVYIMILLVAPLSHVNSSHLPNDNREKSIVYLTNLQQNTAQGTHWHCNHDLCQIQVRASRQ